LVERTKDEVMKNLMVVVGVVVFAAPGTSKAEGLGIRVGLESPLYTHSNQNGQSVSFSIGDTFQPAINILGEYYLNSLIALGGEFREGFLATGSGTLSGCTGNNCSYQRTGTFIGPNLTLDLGLLFVRAAVPLHLEPSPFRMDFRAAGGLKLGISLISLYAELLADFPLAGSNVSAFSSQQFGVGAGVWIKL